MLPAQYQFPLGQIVLRKCTGQEDGSILPRRAALPYQEHHVLPALQASLNAIKIILAVDRLLIHLKHNIAARKANIVGE